MYLLVGISLLGLCVLDVIQSREFNKRLAQAELSRDKFRDKYNDLRVKYASLKSKNGGR